MVGDDALKQAIRKYRAEDDKDPKYVEQLIEAAAKRDLGWFFDDWVYQDRGLPDFHVQSVHPWTDRKRGAVHYRDTGKPWQCRSGSPVHDIV